MSGVYDSSGDAQLHQQQGRAQIAKQLEQLAHDRKDMADERLKIKSKFESDKDPTSKGIVAGVSKGVEELSKVAANIAEEGLAGHDISSSGTSTAQMGASTLIGGEELAESLKKGDASAFAKVLLSVATEEISGTSTSVGIDGHAHVASKKMETEASADTKKTDRSVSAKGAKGPKITGTQELALDHLAAVTILRISVQKTHEKAQKVRDLVTSGASSKDISKACQELDAQRKHLIGAGVHLGTQSGALQVAANMQKEKMDVHNLDFNTKGSQVALGLALQAHRDASQALIQAAPKLGSNVPHYNTNVLSAGGGMLAVTGALINSANVTSLVAQRQNKVAQAQEDNQTKINDMTLKLIASEQGITNQMSADAKKYANKVSSSEGSFWDGFAEGITFGLYKPPGTSSADATSEQGTMMALQSKLSGISAKVTAGNTKVSTLGETVNASAQQAQSSAQANQTIISLASSMTSAWAQAANKAVQAAG